MKPWQIVLMAGYTLLCGVLALVGAPLVAFFAKWDVEPTTWTGGAPNNGPPTIRGDLPWWLRWFQTFDERLPGGMYEPTVREWLPKYGWYGCSVRWMWRNRMFGLTKALFGRPLGRGEQPRGMRWKDVGPLRFGAGWKKYRATPEAHWFEGPFVELPSVTVRIAKRDV